MKYLNDTGGRFKLPLKDDAGSTVCTLLWGDPLLVNVRSDGRRILCATMKEGSSDFDLQVFDAGVAPV